MSRRVNEQSLALAREWRRLGRAATIVAVITSPALFVALYDRFQWPLFWAVIGTILGVAAFRGLMDVLAHRLIPAPSLYGAEKELQAQDVIWRRRLYYWRRKYRLVRWILVVLAISVAISIAINSITGGDTSVWGALGAVGDFLARTLPQMSGYLLVLPFLFLINFVILFGPMLALGIQQIKAYEPGDADWGVKLADVRGQAEAKEEVTRVVSLWQSGEAFVKAGGKRERGVLFLGAPGTGKTMLSKAIATSFNCPFVTIPGSGFAQTFIGMDAVLVRWLAWKARRLSQKWGGQCIVFIDEIDAVGMRRQALGGGGASLSPSLHDELFYGPMGALTMEGDLVLENKEWRERMFARRADSPRQIYPAFYDRIRNIVPGFMGGGGGGGLALNQLLVVMDGIDEPPAMRKWMTRKMNTFLDALYIVPQRIGKVRAAPQAAAAAVRADLLHRGLQRRPRGARPGAHAPRPHGPPHLLPHALVGGPARHLRPLPRQRRPRGGPRRPGQARRAGADHQRLLPGDDRPGLLARAHVRALRRVASGSRGWTSSAR